MSKDYSLVYILSCNCNFRCRYCYESTNVNSKSPALTAGIFSVADMLTVFDLFCKKYGTSPTQVTFFGGEPLLHKSLIYEFIHAAKNGRNCSTKFATITNASLLDEKFQQFIVNNFSTITFSVDGAKAIHNRNRVAADGTPTFDRVIQNIRHFQKINLQCGSPVYTCIEATLTDAYIGSSMADTDMLCTETWGLFKNLRIPIIDYIPVKGDCGSLFSPHTENSKASYVIDNLVSLWFDDFIHLNLTTDVLSFRSVLFSLIKKNKPQLMCAAGESYFAVAPNMKVYDCQVSLFNGKPPIMSVENGSLISLQAVTFPTDNNNIQCRECVCQGGCTHYCKAEWYSLETAFPNSCLYRRLVQDIMGKKIKETYATGGRNAFIKAVKSYYGKGN